MEKNISDEKIENKIPETTNLSLKKKITISIIFIIGIILSYPTILPLGIICAGILLFQKNKKANILGVLLLIIQIFLLLGFLAMKII
ncbi:MAG: hypothetical protein ACP6IY_14820 [Promethearchaeia archaeon]